MKMFLTVLMVGLICGSCNHKNEASQAACTAFKSSAGAAFREDEFSAWMTKAEQQVIHDNKPAGQYFADIEGRYNGGLNQYRHVLRPFDQYRYAAWAVYWGLTAEEFYQVELKMLKTGHVRQHLQVFVDGQGQAFHQAVWLKPKPTLSNPKPEATH